MQLEKITHSRTKMKHDGTYHQALGQLPSLQHTKNDIRYRFLKKNAS